MGSPLAVEIDLADWAYSLSAEQAVLGAVLLDNSAMDQVADVLTERDFYTSDHRAVFRAVTALLNSGKAADLVTVSERLHAEDAQRFESSGGASYLGSIAEATPGVSNVRHYAEIVRSRSLRRQLYAVGNGIVDAAMRSRTTDVRELVDAAESAVFGLTAEGQRGRQDFQDLKAVLAKVLEFVDHQYHRDNRDAPEYTTGFLDLDKQTGGLHPGELIILAARPSMGKSTLALNISEHLARARNQWVLFFSLEMGNREQGMRLVSSQAKVNLQRMFAGRLYDHEWPKLTEAFGRLVDVRIAFNEQAYLTVGEMRSLARRAQRELGPSCLIVVDYLQLMVAGTSDSNRANQLAEISRGLKLLAKELHVPVIALSQLNRELEKRVNKRPVMSDLRDSGALEQDADAILFIYRDEVYHANSLDKGVAEIIIAKQRNGPVGTIRLTFRADHTRFDNYIMAEERAA